MKRVLSAAIFAASLAALSIPSAGAFAATITTEPSLPLDIASWNKSPEDRCVKEGRIVVDVQYSKGTKSLNILTKNGQRVAQVFKERADHTVIFYVKNSPDSNWLVFASTEWAEWLKQAEKEAGMSSGEFYSCIDKK